jgi:predicted nucleotidyltransferase
MARLIEQHRAAILRLAAKYGARNVRVFGSTARGGATESSDVDFLVELDAGRSLLDQ